MKYCINGIEFKSKEAVKSYVRDNILYSYPDKRPIRKQHFDFMFDLLLHHPKAGQKIGSGVSAIWSQPNPQWYGNRGFWLRRTDGTETDFSFYECISPSSPEQDVKRAFRTAVRPQIDEFRASQFDNKIFINCPFSGEMTTFNNCHVDHDPPFDELLASFCNMKNVNLKDIPVKAHGDGHLETIGWN